MSIFLHIFAVLILKIKKMAVYEPITEEQKPQWIEWLEDQKKYLDGLHQDEISREVLQTEEGDLHEVKNMVGNFLATLKNETVTIN